MDLQGGLPQCSQVRGAGGARAQSISIERRTDHHHQRGLHCDSRGGMPHVPMQRSSAVVLLQYRLKLSFIWEVY